MTPDEAIESASTGQLHPVYLLLGEEHHLVSAVLDALRRAVVSDGALGLNEDHLTAGDVTADAALTIAKTLPMMATRRFVVIRALERWESRGEAKAKGKSATTHLDRIAEYVESPSSSTVLVLTASKLDNRRRLVTVAKKRGLLVECQPLSRNALPSWIAGAASRRNKRLAPGVGALLAELIGADLSQLDDAIERLALYVGAADIIGEDAVGECIVQVKPSTVWELVGAVGRRDVGPALTALAKVYDAQDRGLRLLGVLGWSTRQLIRFAAATREGLSPPDAAKQAGAPPFKARDLAAQIRNLDPGTLDGWLLELGHVDLDLKGASKRPPRAVLEAAIINMCGGARKTAKERAPS